jgi:DNA (cytosine-5)-methyltransferase 1
MGFPKDFKSCEVLGNSYKQIGNSVCVPMIYQIALEVKKELSQPISKSTQTNIYSSKQLSLFN